MLVHTSVQYETAAGLIHSLACSPPSIQQTGRLPHSPLQIFGTNIIMRHVKYKIYFAFHLYQCDIPTLMSTLSANLQLNVTVTFFRIGSTCNKSFNSYNKPSSSPLLDGEISSSNLSSNPNVPLDLGTLTKRPLKGHQNIFID